jgi:hypothetical protein
LKGEKISNIIKELSKKEAMRASKMQKITTNSINKETTYSNKERRYKLDPQKPIITNKERTYLKGINESTTINLDILYQ